MLEFRKASRKAVPMLLSISGVSGSGKTYSALKLASGLAGEKGRVGMIDAENGRGEIYADSPGIIQAYPDGYEYARIDPPFSPKAYIGAIDAAEQAGITVAILDSASHEWEGIDGCCDIAEKKKLRGLPNWSLAKLEHKRFVNRCLASKMHIIFCLRAREKVNIIEEGGKTHIVPIGIQPIAEKGFVFEMLVSLRVEEETHHAIPLKVPEPLVNLFPKEALVTEEMGERIRLWNEGGQPADEGTLLVNEARAAASNGVAAYKAFYGSLSPGKKKYLREHGHEDFKFDAERADLEAAESQPEDVAQPPYEAADADVPDIIPGGERV